MLSTQLISIFCVVISTRKGEAALWYGRELHLLMAIESAAKTPEKIRGDGREPDGVYGWRLYLPFV
jgi:hypothetical protein